MIQPSKPASHQANKRQFIMQIPSHTNGILKINPYSSFLEGPRRYFEWNDSINHLKNSENAEWFYPYSFLNDQCSHWVVDRLREVGVSIPGISDEFYPDPHDEAHTLENLYQCKFFDGICKSFYDKPTSWLKDLFDAAQDFLIQPVRDPLALDLDGDGLETTRFSPNSPVWFDHDVNGAAEGTGWLNSDDGFLVLDRNGNGLIDNGSELFGDHTPLNGGGDASNGFAALAQEDTNGDGLVNAQDTNWSNLRIWRDLNQDGMSQAGELFTLDEIGIAGIQVTPNGTGGAQNGNQIGATGSFIWADGHEGTIGDGQTGDIDFSVDTFHSHFTDALPVPDDVAALPQLGGSGLVRSLREAITQSEMALLCI